LREVSQLIDGDVALLNDEKSALALTPAGRSDFAAIAGGERCRRRLACRLWSRRINSP
jgi:hypothetical protein